MSTEQKLTPLIRTTRMAIGVQERTPQYTPGPWKVIKCRNLIQIGGCWHSTEPTIEVATVTRLKLQNGMHDANARLIAAAPNMASQLQAVAGWFDEMMRDFAAIASAKGDDNFNRVKTLAGLAAVNAERQAGIIRSLLHEAT